MKNMSQLIREQRKWARLKKCIINFSAKKTESKERDDAKKAEKGGRGRERERVNERRRNKLVGRPITVPQFVSHSRCQFCWGIITSRCH
ncbi:hypothetical protein L6452_28463 [Arctium lappa]|uniref:Uncharacterized protein n=1 Tax=Arctium lappa TaxID=4217 RepID=A0ACB8ZYS2_ARCLA|nr:hypothetical protein L6452_28463 [Arctium lappa]